MLAELGKSMNKKYHQLNQAITTLVSKQAVEIGGSLACIIGQKLCEYTLMIEEVHTMKNPSLKCVGNLIKKFLGYTQGHSKFLCFLFKILFATCSLTITVLSVSFLWTSLTRTLWVISCSTLTTPYNMEKTWMSRFPE